MGRLPAKRPACGHSRLSDGVFGGGLPEGRLHLHDVLPVEEVERVVPLGRRDAHSFDPNPGALQRFGGLCMVAATCASIGPSPESTSRPTRTGRSGDAPRPASNSRGTVAKLSAPAAIAAGSPPLEPPDVRGTALGQHPGGVERVLGRERHAVQRPGPHARRAATSGKWVIRSRPSGASPATRWSGMALGWSGRRLPVTGFWHAVGGQPGDIQTWESPPETKRSLPIM